VKTGERSLPDSIAAHRSPIVAHFDVGHAEGWDAIEVAGSNRGAELPRRVSPGGARAGTCVHPPRPREPALEAAMERGDEATV